MISSFPWHGVGGGRYKTEGRTLRDWEVSVIWARAVKFPNNNNNNKRLHLKFFKRKSVAITAAPYELHPLCVNEQG